jgi:Ni,Fe-hydrogenase III small subunit
VSGWRLQAVETPSHADVLLVCGPAPAPLAEEVRRLQETMVSPWVQVYLGDCAGEEGESPVTGCPPSPEAIAQAIVAAWKGRARPRKEPEGELG